MPTLSVVYARLTTNCDAGLCEWDTSAAQCDGGRLISGGSRGNRADLAMFRGGFVIRLGPQGGIGQQARDELRVQRVSRLVGFDARQQRVSDQRQVSDQVEGLVPPEFVREAQRTVHDAALVEHDGVVERAAANQTHPAQSVEVLDEAE